MKFWVQAGIHRDIFSYVKIKTINEEIHKIHIYMTLLF